MTQMLVHKNFLLRNVTDSFKLELAFQLRNPFAKKKPALIELGNSNTHFWRYRSLCCNSVKALHSLGSNKGSVANSKM